MVEVVVVGLKKGKNKDPESWFGDGQRIRQTQYLWVKGQVLVNFGG